MIYIEKFFIGANLDIQILFYTKSAIREKSYHKSLSILSFPTKFIQYVRNLLLSN